MEVTLNDFEQQLFAAFRTASPHMKMHILQFADLSEADAKAMLDQKEEGAEPDNTIKDGPYAGINSTEAFDRYLEEKGINPYSEQAILEQTAFAKLRPDLYPELEPSK